MKSETLNKISETIESVFGLSYQDFDRLDYDEQQKIIEKYRKKHKTKKFNNEEIMIGSGEHSCFVDTGITVEESYRKLNDELDDAYRKPGSLIKKLIRRIGKF